MTRRFGQRSNSNLAGVHPDLRAVASLALEIGPEDFTVIEGPRSKEQMWENWGKGRTAAECLRKAVPTRYARPDLAKVTWLNNPLASNHRVFPDGFGRAIDAVTIRNGKPDWSSCERIAVAMFEASRRLNIPIRWGADWDRDGKPHERGETDSPHFELDR